MNAITPERINAIWNHYVSELKFSKAERIEVPEATQVSETNCKTLAPKLLTPWLYCFDEALLWLYAARSWAWFRPSRKNSKSHLGADMLLGRSVRLAGAIRLLLVSGYDEPARPLIRTFHETLDLLLGVLADDSFHLEYTKGDATYDEDEFWRKNLSRTQKGTNETLLTSYLRKAGKGHFINDSGIDAWMPIGRCGRNSFRVLLMWV